ncbi:MAG: preprotein translocase subunit SecY [Lachnospiraceae bacterium]|nr:preprotein translocase subunit SecY [Lachnospiraceae bacterium]
MLKKMVDALKVKDIRHRLGFVLLCLVIIRIGSQIPVPGVNNAYFKQWFAEQGGDAFNFFDAFTGGSFSSMSILALSITPYITASIIIELLTIAIPALEEMQRDGEDGRKKLVAITRYLTVGLSLFESIAMAVGFGNQGLIPNMNFIKAFTVVVALTAGSCFLMWIGEQMTEKGIGNGISMVLLINILSRVPQDLTSLYETFVSGKTIAKGALAVLIIAAIIAGMVALVVLLNGGQRRIPVQYSRKTAGSRMIGGQTTHIPLKINTAGVIPVIFASSIMSFPGIIATFAGKSNAGGVLGNVLSTLSESKWFDITRPVYSIGAVIYVVLVIFFAYFYTSITFNPLEVADNMKKQGGFIPGIRPGKPTVEYLNKILNYIIFIGAIGLVIIALIPFFFNGVFHASVSFGGTSIIIIVGVLIEAVKQIESKMVVRNYKGFLSE